MSEKVKLPRGVAEAIETLRGMDFKVTNHDIIYAFAASKSDEYPALIEYASKNFDNLLKALVNGYEVEETPEEKVMKQYNRPVGFFDKENDQEEDIYRKGMRFVIDTLNIKIDGVNT